jgi:NAD(P)-dependent dehydrogenase (short-subunit alcohol dehydrogenase family)
VSRVFVTGSADGLGLMAARLMVEAGHSVVVHGRNRQRADRALEASGGAEAAVVGDLESIQETRALAEQVNRLGAFDSVIHNAGIGYGDRRRIATVDKLPRLFAVNSLAPYILTAMITKPKRLVYVSSGMHRGADGSLEDLTWDARPWNGSSAYADSKLHDVILAFAVARKWPDVYSNAIEPGWVATKMGGANAPDDLDAAPRTQVWLATSDESGARVSGKYFYHMHVRQADSAASDEAVQERFLSECARLSGVAFPA